MARAGPLRRGAAVSVVIHGSSVLLPGLRPPVQTLLQEQASQVSSASTILSSHFQPCPRVFQHSSHTIWHQRQRVLLLDDKFQNGIFSMKHFSSSFHGDSRALEQQAFNLHRTREPERTVDVQSFRKPFDESHRHPGKYPSLVAQLLTSLEPQVASGIVDQSKIRDGNYGGKLNQSLGLDLKPKAGLNLVVQDRLQFCASYGYRGSSQDSTQGNESTLIYSAGTVSEAINLLKNRLQRGMTTNLHTYLKVLHMCLKQKDLLATKQVHDCIIESGLAQNAYVASTLLSVYGKCGGLLDACRVFDELEKKTVFNWTSMIAGYAEGGHAESALELFKFMRQEGARPNSVTCLCLLKAFASPLALSWGKEAHMCIRKVGFESDVRVGTALLHMYAKCGSIDDAQRVFDRMDKRNCDKGL